MCSLIRRAATLCQAHSGTIGNIYLIEDHAMALVVSTLMAKKTEFIRIRVDAELKRALNKAAERQDRQEADQARYLLRKGLGLHAADDARDADEEKRGTAIKHSGRTDQ